MTTLPIIDISAPTGAHPDDTETVREIDHACRDVGFFAVVGHSIDAQLQDEMLAAARGFFAQPTATKRRIAIEQSTHHRGYAAIGGETLQPDLLGDAKETLDLGLERSVDDPGRSPLEGPNQWPDLPGFRPTVERYQAAALATASRVLGLIAHALDLAPEFFEPALTHPLMGTRMAHYPPVNAQNDRHRYSIPVFVDPAYMTVVECLASCVGPDRPRRYDPILAGEYLQSRFDDTFAYRHDR